MLSEKNTEILYISIDEAENDQRWLGMIKYYNLDGNHIRAYSSLQSSVRDLIVENGNISIPQYIIVDESGKIVDVNAPRPSEIDELRNRL